MNACPDELRKTPVTSPSFLDKVAQLTALHGELLAQEMDFLLQCFNLTMSRP